MNPHSDERHVVVDYRIAATVDSVSPDDDYTFWALA